MAKQVLGKVAYVSKGNYDNELFYEINDVVSYNGSSYVALGDTIGNLPTDTEYWQLLAAKGDTYSVTSEDLEEIKNDIIADSTNEFNQNVENKTNAFNEHVTTKTNEFDSHVVEKIQEFDENAEEYDKRITDLSNRTKRIETDIFDSGEASGTGINLQDSTLAEFQEVKIDGVGNQETTTGKNLANYNDSSTSFNFNIADIEADTTYTLYLNINGYQSFNLKYDNSNGNTIKAAFNLTGKQCITFTTIKAGILYMNAYGSSSGSFKSFDEIMLVKGEYNTDNIGNFEKYTGGEPSPNSDYEQPIEVIEDDFELVSCGKNLFNTNNKPIWTNSTNTEVLNNGIRVIAKGTGTWQSAVFRMFKFKPFIGKKLKIKSNFIASANNIPQLNIGYCNESGDKRVQVNNLSISGASYTLNIQETENNIDKPYIYIGLVANTIEECNPGDYVDYTDIIVTFEDDITYEPYTETRQIITLPEDEFAGKIDDTYKDQFRINYNEEDGKYHLYLDKNIGKDVFDGDETWTRTLADDLYRYYTKVSKIAKGTTGERGLCISNYFIYNNNYATDKIGTIFLYTRDNTCFIYPKEQDSVEEFKQWLQTHNTIIYYVLAEPYTLDLGVVDMPLSYYPITNVYNTCAGIPNMYVKYYRDFKNTLKEIPKNTSDLNNDSGFIDKLVDNLDNYYNKDEVDLIKKDVEINKTDIKNLSNRTKRIETDIFDSGEASGTGINLQDSTLAEFQEVKIDGFCKQTTTNGNQLIDMANPNSKSTEVTSTFENDILTIVGTAGASYQSISWLLSKTLLENNKGKTLKYKDKSSNITNKSAASTVQVSVGYLDDTPTFYRRLYNFNTTGTDTYVIPSDISNISYVNVGIYTNNSADTDIENTVTIEEPLLYFDDNDTYEPYTGAEPSPSPDYEQPIEVIEDDFELISCGSQLVDFNKPSFVSTYTTCSFENNILVVSNNEGTYKKANFTITDLIKKNKGKKICFSFDDISLEGDTMTNLVIVDEKGPHYNALILSSGTKYPYLLPEDTNNIISARIEINSNNSSTAQKGKVTITKPIIYFGELNSPPTYESYTETRQTITMPEGEFAGKIDETYKDQFRINYNEEDGKYHLYLDKNIGKDVFDGSSDEVYSVQQATTNTDIAYVYTRILDNLALSSLGKSNNFIRTNDLQMDSDKGESFAITSAISGNNLRFFIKKDRLSEISQTGFRSYLNTNNVEIYYALKEPYTLDLGVVNMPLSYYPITNVYNTCVGIPNMYVKYYRDFKKTITTMQVDIQELREQLQELKVNQENFINQLNSIYQYNDIQESEVIE